MGSTQTASGRTTCWRIHQRQDGLPSQFQGSLHVQQGPDCQPRRHRLPHHPHAQSPGRAERGRVFRSRRAGPSRARGRRGLPARSRTRGRELPQGRTHPADRQGLRRRSHPPRLRFPVGEPGLCPGLRRRGHRLHRPHAGPDACLRSEAHGAGSGRAARRAAAARHRPAGGCGAGPRRSAAHRLPGHAQEHGRWRRHRHAPGVERGRTQRRVCFGAAPGQRQLQGRRPVPGKVRRTGAPHRGAGVR
ncbi:hypothetical protein FQZ97_894190 [compost metagenome]